MSDVSARNLDEWIRTSASSRRDRNVVAFLAIREEVKAGLEAGHAATTLFAYMRDGGRVSFCYDTFLKYVHRYIRQQNEAASIGVQRTQAFPRTNGNAVPPAKAKSKPNENIGFNFNPVVNKDDLI